MTMLTWVLLIGASVFAYALWAMFFEGKITVEPAGRERVVLKDLSGHLTVYGPGEHYPLAGKSEFIAVSINREPMEVTEDQVKTSNGVLLLADYRYDVLAGRRYDPVNGGLKLPRGVKSIDDASTVDDEMIKRAVTRLDYPKHEEFVRQRVHAVVEKELAAYTDDELLLPAENNPRVPKGKEENWFYQVIDIDDPELKPVFTEGELVEITNAKILYDRLGKLIELKVNHDELLPFGLNILSFRFTNLRTQDEEGRDALEMRARLQKLRRAVEGTRPGQPTLSDAELLAGTKDGQLGQAVLGKSIADAARSIADAVSRALGQQGSSDGGTPDDGTS